MDLGVIIGIVASVVTILAFYYQYQKQPRENREFAIQQFEFGKAATERLLQKLSQFVVTNHAENAHLMQGLTFETGIQLLIRSLNEMYTDQNLTLLKRAQISGKQLESITATLTDHYKQAINIDTHFELYVKKSPLQFLP